MTKAVNPQPNWMREATATQTTKEASLQKHFLQSHNSFGPKKSSLFTRHATKATRQKICAKKQRHKENGLFYAAKSQRNLSYLFITTLILASALRHLSEKTVITQFFFFYYIFRRFAKKKKEVSAHFNPPELWEFAGSQTQASNSVQPSHLFLAFYDM